MGKIVVVITAVYTELAQSYVAQARNNLLLPFLFFFKTLTL